MQAPRREHSRVPAYAAPPTRWCAERAAHRRLLGLRVVPLIRLEQVGPLLDRRRQLLGGCPVALGLGSGSRLLQGCQAGGLARLRNRRGLQKSGEK